MSQQSTRVGWIFLLIIGLGFGVAPNAVRADGPSKTYPFTSPPLEIYDKLAKANVGKVEPFAAADRKYLEDFWAARTAKQPKAVPPADDAAVTAHLIASGVGEKARAGYLKKFNDLTDAAKKATADAKNDREKADQLLRFLHKEVMAKGYELDQSSFAGVFDTGKYNCVSSSCLYYLVGTRLGLKLQPVLIPGSPFLPGHAAVDLIDGRTRIEVEPTNPDGYDWPTKLKNPGVIVLGPQPDRKKAYDSDGFGLASSIASNLCSATGKSDPIAAIRSGAIALTLAPTDPAAETNLLAGVINWALRLDDGKKFEEALAVYEFARGALGPVKNLENNHRVAWAHYLDATFGAGQIRDGAKVLARAATAFPKDKDFTSAGAWVGRAADRKADKDGWQASLNFADAALKELTGDDAMAVRWWKDSARRRWSQGLLDTGDVAGSFKVLAAGLTADPDNKELLAGLVYHAQEGLAYLDAKKGTAEAAAHFKELVKAYPKVKELRETAFGVASRGVDRLEDAKKFAEALKAVTTYEPLAGDRADELRVGVYDAWARVLVNDGKWEAAIEKYVEGLAAHPKSDFLTKNAIATVDQWAFKAIDQKDWATAIGRYDTGLKHFSDSKHLKDNREYCVKQRDAK